MQLYFPVDLTGSCIWNPDNPAMTSTTVSTISWGLHLSSRLHTGACMNFVLLTYLLLYKHHFVEKDLPPKTDVRRTAGLRIRALALHSVYYRYHPHRWQYGHSSPLLCRWYTAVCQWIRERCSLSSVEDHRLHQCNQPMDVIQSPEIERWQNTIHLVGFTTAADQDFQGQSRDTGRRNISARLRPQPWSRHRQQTDYGESCKQRREKLLLPAQAASFDPPLSSNWR